MYFRKKQINVKSLLLWYYRVLGLTFGGSTITQNNELAVNQKLKYFGHITTLLITILLNILMQLNAEPEHMKQLYNTEFKLIYYLFFLIKILTRIQFSVNLIYYQMRGIQFFKLLLEYPIKHIRSKIIIISLWIVIFIFQLFAIYINFNVTKNQISFMEALRILFTVIYFTTSISAIYLMSWGNKILHLFKNL